MSCYISFDIIFIAPKEALKKLPFLFVDDQFDAGNTGMQQGGMNLRVKGTTDGTRTKQRTAGGNM